MPRIKKIFCADLLSGKEFKDDDGNIWGAIKGDNDELTIKKKGTDTIMGELTVRFINGKIVNTSGNQISWFKNVLVTSYQPSS